MARLISWLLNGVYLAVIAAYSPLIIWQSVRTGKYRDGYREKLLGLVPKRAGNATCIWIHAVSVGEVNLISTLLRELRAMHPDWQFVISTTSRTGYQLARKKYTEHAVFYCPLDFSWAVNTAMRRIRPTMLVLAELELWPNLITSAKRHGARVAIVNGRLSDHSFPGYRRIGPFVAAQLRRVDLIAAQNEESASRFLALGAPAERVYVTGSLKYDGAETDRNNPRTDALRQLAGIDSDDVVFLAGSTQEPEEQYAVEIYSRLAKQHPCLRLILVPRHPERFEAVAKFLDDSTLPWRRRSELESRVAGVERQRPPSSRQSGGSQSLDPSHTPNPILLVDTVGELGAWWGTANIAFVGGSFGERGGQNMIEPAAYGNAVCFGPNIWNFRDIVAALTSNNAGITVQNTGELESFVRRCLDDRAYAAELGSRAQWFVRSQLGATHRSVALLESLLDASLKYVHRAA